MISEWLLSVKGSINAKEAAASQLVADHALVWKVTMYLVVKDHTLTEWMDTTCIYAKKQTFH